MSVCNRLNGSRSYKQASIVGCRICWEGPAFLKGIFYGYSRLHDTNLHNPSKTTYGCMYCRAQPIILCFAHSLTPFLYYYNLLPPRILNSTSLLWSPTTCNPSNPTLGASKESAKCILLLCRLTQRALTRIYKTESGSEQRKEIWKRVVSLRSPDPQINMHLISIYTSCEECMLVCFSVILEEFVTQMNCKDTTEGRQCRGGVIYALSPKCGMMSARLALAIMSWHSKCSLTAEQERDTPEGAAGSTRPSTAISRPATSHLSKL